MRIATIVLVAYLLCVVVAAVWRLMPAELIRDAVPDLGALTAAYLGLTARRSVAPPVGGSVALGYLVDLISGAPPGSGGAAATTRRGRVRRKPPGSGAAAARTRRGLVQ